MGARIDAHDQVDVLLVEQALGLGDRDLGLGLGIGDHGRDLVALDPALLVDHVDRDLGADRGGLGAAGRERAGEVVDHADLDLALVLRRERRRGQRAERQRRAESWQACEAVAIARVSLSSRSPRSCLLEPTVP